MLAIFLLNCAGAFQKQGNHFSNIKTYMNVTLVRHQMSFLHLFHERNNHLFHERNFQRVNFACEMSQAALRVSKSCATGTGSTGAVCWIYSHDWLSVGLTRFSFPRKSAREGTIVLNVTSQQKTLSIS